jgi:hypothetical protein
VFRFGTADFFEIALPDEAVFCVAYSPDGKLVAFARSRESVVRVRELATGAKCWP